ncbi:MAG: serine hydrolase [Thermoanaerobaculia bacterium]
MPEILAEFGGAGLKEDGLSITVVDITGADANRPFPSASFRGDASYYTASVVKLFYLAYYVAQKERGTIKPHPEIERAVKDMIVESSNDATGLVVDAITGTTSGPPIANPGEWTAWKGKRNAVNRWFRARGYGDINVNQKTFCEDAYGREQLFREDGKNRNRLTTRETARLVKEIAMREVAGAGGTAEMLGLLHRDLAAKADPDSELEAATALAEYLPEGSAVWSKSGWAYDVRHLAARVVLANGSDLAIAVFTRGVKDEKKLIPRVFGGVAAHFSAR